MTLSTIASTALISAQLEKGASSGRLSVWSGLDETSSQSLRQHSH
jgi:hypothetical protein